MTRVLIDGLDHPEGVAWGPDGRLYAGGESGQIYRIDVDAATHELVGSTGGFCLGLALDARANVYVCDQRHAAVMRMTPQGDVAVLSAGTPDRPMVTPNFPVFDVKGNLYVSDSGTWPNGGGCIYRIPPGGVAEVWSTAASRFANGIALAPDGLHLYVVESVLPGVTRIPIRRDGSAGELEPVLDLPVSVPDGLAFAADGTLIISCYRPDRVYTLSPAGELAVLVDDPLGTLVAAPTNVAFGRSDLRSLFLASLGRWHIAEVAMDRPGAPLHYPELARQPQTA
jgi:gluconolactonase